MASVSSTVVANKANVVNFNRTDYQAANKNWSAAQDSDGIMYFGNDNGLLEFDGVRWRLYKPPHDKLVRSVAVSFDGLIFTGGYEEFGFWKRDISGGLIYRSLSEQFKDSFHNDEIWKIWTDDSLVFFQSFTNVYIFDRQTVRKIDPGKNILFLLKVRDEYWLQAMGGALYRMSKDGNFDEIDGSSEFSNTEIRVILPFGEKDYLIGTSTQGIFIYDGVRFKPWNVDFSRQVIPFELNNGILGGNGHYYFGTILNGLYEVSCSGEAVNHWSADNYMQNSTVLSLYGDKLGNIWVALDRGISFVQYLPGMDCYIDSQGKAGSVYSAALYNGMLYLGTNQGMFMTSQDELKKSDTFRNLKLMEGTQGQVWDMEIVDGQLFFGHNKGLRVIGKDNTPKTMDGITTGVYKIKKINYSGNDYLFVGTYINAQIMKRNNGNWRILHNDDLSGLREPVTNIERDHLGNIWLEHARKGVYRCVFSEDMSRLKSARFYGSHGTGRLRLFKIGERVIFSANDSTFVYDDNADKIVFHEGLNRFFKDIRELKNITPVSANRFWALTSNNLYRVRFDGQNFEIEYSYHLENKNLALVNNYENAVRLNDSLNLVCLDRGFLLHSATGAAQHDTLPSPRLRSVSTSDIAKETVYIDPMSPNVHRLNFRKNTILFDFFATDAFPGNLFFQYRLDGMDAKWTAPTRAHEVLFERLPPGNYTFRLRTCDHLNNYSEPAVFSFSISPPWYRLPLAYMIYVVLFVALAIVAWNIWLKRLSAQHLLKVRLREEQRLRNQNDELRKEIDDKNLKLLAQTTFIIQKKGKNMDVEEDWKIFLILFEQAHVDFFKHIKADFPDLTPHDLKLCACLKLNLSSKDIASLLNISLRGVENSRYRLRKKMGLMPEQNLTELFMRY
jgi:ligand-binding sensor domain-containing protein